LDLRAAASRPVDSVLDALGATVGGLNAEQVRQRTAQYGANAIQTRKATRVRILARQVRSPIVVLLILAACLSYVTGDQSNAAIIGIILVGSIGLGFTNEYQAERTARGLQTRIGRDVLAWRDGRETQVDVRSLVPGDIVRVGIGTIVPADIRLIQAVDLECDESVLTGEAMPVAKTAEPVRGVALADLTDCVLMGTVVQSGSGVGVVVATGASAEFGRIAQGLNERLTETAFARGLARFSMLLLGVAVALTTLIFAINLLLHRPLLDSLLFSLAIAVGMTPQLLPAIVSTSLATGSRMLARRNVLVKRLMCIEDLGNMDVLVTDKTGTLTEGRISFVDATAAAVPADEVIRLGLLSCDEDYTLASSTGTGQNAVDEALWRSAPDRTNLRGYRRLDLHPFDHGSRTTSALVAGPDGRHLHIIKGAPESVLARCANVTPEAQEALERLFGQGSRVIAVAVGDAGAARSLGRGGSSDGFNLAGYLNFLDKPKSDARASLEQLASLDVQLKVATGDNPIVAEKVCRDVGLVAGGMLTGPDIDAMNDDELAAAALTTTVFARVSPEQKARIIRLLRRDHTVGFLGDGVNDALALHKADIGISVDSASDVAKDAADVVLLDKDLRVLAQAVVEGRRIFANTIKYVLMGTSSNFGNMFSAALASGFLSFLPMLPGQILLNNLLYDLSQLAIPTDRVDAEQLHKPAHWDIGQIRRFMLIFGPISSLFDFATFALMLAVFDATPSEFRAGWFVESLATQTLIVFAIRTHRVPFLRSRPSRTLAASVLAVVAVGSALPFSPLSETLDFARLPWRFFLALTGMVLIYLVIVEVAKKAFLDRRSLRVESDVRTKHLTRQARHPQMQAHRIHRRATRFTRSRHPQHTEGRRARAESV